jgi:hypothetical protein
MKRVRKAAPHRQCRVSVSAIMQELYAKWRETRMSKLHAGIAGVSVSVKSTIGRIVGNMHSGGIYFLFEWGY